MIIKDRVNRILCFLAVSVAITSCYDPTQKADPNDTTTDPGIEYAPQMYHSRPYDALTQVVDSSTRDNKYAYNSAPHFALNDEAIPEGFEYNVYYSNMRNYPEGIVKRVGTNGKASVLKEKPWLFPYDNHDVSDSGYVKADKMFPENPLLKREQQDSTMVLTEASQQYVEKGGILYTKFCMHCHGSEGKGDGPVSATHEPAGPFSGIANLTGGGIKIKGPGHIFHVITNGKGQMGAHGSQLNQEERWMIVAYVKEVLQK